MLIHYIISSLLTFVANLIFAFIAFFKNKNSKINRLFSLYCLSLSFWSICYFKMIISRDTSEGLFWARLLHVGAIFVPIFSLHFSSILINIYNENRKIIRSSYWVGAILIGLLFTPLYVKDAKPIFTFKEFIVMGPLYHLFTIFFYSQVIYLLLILWRAIRKAKGVLKNQLRYVFLAYFVLYTIGAPSAFTPLFNIETPVWGFYAVPFCMLFFTYAVVNYQLMDIRLVLSRIIIFLVVYSFFWLIPTLTMIWYRNYLLSILDRIYWYLFAFLEAILTTIGLIIFRKLQINIEKYILREESLRSDEITRLSYDLVAKKDVLELFKLVVKRLREICKIRRVSMFMFKQSDDNYSFVYEEKESQEKKKPIAIIKNSNLLIAALKRQRRPLIYEDILKTDPETAKELKTIGAKAVIPCFYLEELLAIIILGEKQAGGNYTVRELIGVRLLANQIGLELKNIIFLQEVRFTDKQDTIRQWQKAQILQRKVVSWLSQAQSLPRLYRVIAYLATTIIGELDCQLYIYIPEEKKFVFKVYRCRGLRFFSEEIESKHPLIKLLTERKYPLLYEDIKRYALELKSSDLEEIVQKATQIGAEMLVPIAIDEKVLGFLALGQRRLGIKYNHEDIKTMAVFANQAALALELRAQAEGIVRDPLTKIYNRLYYNNRLPEETSRGIRHDRDKKDIYSLISFDIDHFKHINDTYGHQIGDMVLKVVGDAAQSVCNRREEPVCRVGGEEFAVILIGTGLEGAKIIAERLRAIIPQEIKNKVKEIKWLVTISLGISVFSPDSPEYKEYVENFAIEKIVEKVVSNADKALYEAKNTGRNKICWDKKIEQTPKTKRLQKIKKVFAGIVNKTKRPIKILMVDDEKVTLWLLSKYFKDLGNIKMFGAQSYQEALEIIKHEQLDIVFLDLQLGNKDGKDLIAPINKNNPKAIILVITAYEERKEEMLALGVKKVYFKPLPIGNIKKDLSEIIRKIKVK